MCVLLTSDINHPYGYNINNQYNHKDINDNKLLKLLYYWTTEKTEDCEIQ